MTRPTPGRVPSTMLAATVRSDRYGSPRRAFVLEEVPVPPVGEGQVLIEVMAAGVNFNGVWASLGHPVDVIAERARKGDPCTYHIAGSDASGVVWAVGPGVERLEVGDEVVLSCGQWAAPPAVQAGGALPTIWGYETNHGAFAEFTVAYEYQCHPKPSRLGWEEAACFLLTAATAYHQLFSWPPHDVRPRDVVLIWGGAGGLGSAAVQLVRNAGATPVAVVSSAERAEHCARLGARVVHRECFSHWGKVPPPEDDVAYAAWIAEVRRFGRAIWDALGERRSPRLVLEHPGLATLPTSIYVCDTHGMVVTCGASTGFVAELDLRFLWMREKRLQGSHFASVAECSDVVDAVARGALDPCLSRVFDLHQIGEAHQLMLENRQPPGNMAIRLRARS